MAETMMLGTAIVGKPAGEEAVEGRDMDNVFRIE